MLDGWYCRSMVTNTEEDEESQEETINYKTQYRSLKRKLKFLIYVRIAWYCNSILEVIPKLFEWFLYVHCAT
jgi:uncharacterized membrane protein YkvA (DUF1232 family)